MLRKCQRFWVITEKLHGSETKKGAKHATWLLSNLTFAVLGLGSVLLVIGCDGGELGIV